MDFLKVALIKPPPLDEVKRRIDNIPAEKLQSKVIRDLHLLIYDAYLKNNFQKLSYLLNSEERSMFDYLFGPEYMKKLEVLPVLPREEVNLLSEVEIRLNDFYQKRTVPKGAFKKAVSLQRKLNVTSKWEKLRITVGTYGYREIAKNIRKFLVQGEIGLSDRERREMRAIFLMKDQMENMESLVMKRLIFVEFNNQLRREDWSNLWEWDSNSPIFKLVFPEPSSFSVSKVKEMVKKWCLYRATFPENKRLLNMKHIVEDLKELTLRRPLGTQQWWDFSEILKGDWKAAMEYALEGKACIVCQAQATYECQHCGDAFCETHTI